MHFYCTRHCVTLGKSVWIAGWPLGDPGWPLGDPGWPCVTLGDLRWPQVTSGNPRWPQMTTGDPELPQMTPSIPGWPQMIPGALAWVTSIFLIDPGCPRLISDPGDPSFPLSNTFKGQMSKYKLGRSILKVDVVCQSWRSKVNVKGQSWMSKFIVKKSEVKWKGSVSRF